MCARLNSNIVWVLFLCAFLVGTAAVATAQEKLHISGYGNMHYMDHNGLPNQVGKKSLNNGFIQLREFSLFLDFTITDAILASAEIEMGDNGTRYTANYAYVDIQSTETLSFRIGKILVPFLSYNENKPNFRQTLMSQPFTAWNLAPVNGIALKFHGFGWSDAGAVVNWNSLLGDVGILDFKLAVINGLGSDSNVLDANTIQLDAPMMMMGDGQMGDGQMGDGQMEGSQMEGSQMGGSQMESGQMESGQMGDGQMQMTVFPTVRPRDGLVQNETNNDLMDNNNNKTVVIKTTFKSTSVPLDIGVSWYRGDWDPASTKKLQMWGGHLNLLARHWMVKGEYVTADVEQDADVNPVADAGLMGPAPINTTTGDYTMYAWYIEGSAIPARWERDRFLRLIVRYDEVDTNDKAPFTPFDRSRITVGAEWQVAPNTRFRYEWQRTRLHDFANAPPPFQNAGGKEFVKMNMASVIFAF